MKVLRVPSTLRAATWKLVILLPLLMLNVWMAAGDLTWQRALIRAWPLFFVFALILGLIRAWIHRGFEVAENFLRFIFIFWLFVNFAGGIAVGSPKLAILAVLYAPMFLLLWRELESAWTESSFDPQLKWYQGSPQGIPDLRAQVTIQGETKSCRVNRFDRRGVFIFTTDAAADWLEETAGQDRVEIEIQFRDQVIALVAQPIRLWTHERVGSLSQGLGLRFIDLPSDLKKRLGDWVEKLRGEGYVSE